jgi:hypothetical protein
MPRFWYAPLLLLVVSGCPDGDRLIVEADCVLTVGPDPAEVKGDVAVATEGFATITLQADRANCKISRIAVLNIDGDYFFPPDDLLESVASGDNATDEEVLLVEVDKPVDIQIPYRPTREGYHRAQIQVLANNAENSETTVEVRGHADSPDASIFPWTVDFGAVDVGNFRCELVTIDNESTLDLVITTVDFDPDAVFYTEEPLPITIEGKTDFDLEVCARPVDDEAITGSLVVVVGELPLQRVTLRLNDCANGSPVAYDRDQDGFTTCGGDCDDTNAAVRPGAVEQADGVDNDCNTMVDDTTPGFDDDGDGFCDHPTTCALPIYTPGDCNDGDADVNPGEVEVLGDGVDNDCDGGVDGGTLDYDSDHYTEAAGDCDPYDATIYPAAPELADGKDNDCDNQRDEGTVLFDDDNDGYCEGLPAGGTPCTDNSTLGDCNDFDATTFPGATDRADYRDNDCDGTVDEGTVNADDDGDGYTEQGGDCNDGNRNIGPATLEIAGNGVDDDCDPTTPGVGEP